jgi:hypothetical protein
VVIEVGEEDRFGLMWGAKWRRGGTRAKEPTLASASMPPRVSLSDT